MGGKLCKPVEFMDLDMVYLNKPEADFFVFDKEGKWSEEVVNHPVLSLSKTFNEHIWYDFTYAPKVDATGR
ncbi:hypothetical protein SteCoe_22195 [Stentor coeruleus]|uniref:Uncharacterized protein n=1 Tax=Stentor coeruleus TaxID=5963 RepID=A0A1R2BND6_9CILI|nr:hypothetical protein SteCoe_22195 [Stentor coeruleus]